MTDASSIPLSQPQLCPTCHYAALSEPWNDRSLDPPCPHCKICMRGLLIGMVFPLAVIVALILIGVGVEFIGPKEVASWVELPEWILIVLPIAHLTYAVWLVWYAAGMRLRLIVLMAAQVGITSYLMWEFPLVFAVLTGCLY
jgi:hypothetical protein